jgi:Trk-type K+ transport system membrane component
MLLGRLEILPVLILFNKKTESFRDIPLWKNILKSW